MGKEDLEKPGKVKLRAYPTLHTRAHTHTENSAQDLIFPYLGTFHAFFSH